MEIFRFKIGKFRKIQLLYLNIAVLFLFSLNNLIAQSAINIDVDDNLVNVKISKFETHCNARYQMEMQIQNSQINIILKDTSAQRCRQNCEIDFDLNISQIPAGNYQINIFADDNFNGKELKRLLFKKEFLITSNFSKSPLSYEFRHSICKNTNESNPSSSNKDSFEIFPNPTVSKISVKFNLRSKSDINFKIMNLLGKELYSVNHKSLQSGQNTITIDADMLQPGMYICKLTGSNGQSYSSKLLWSK